jgi:hypothetical protein
LVKNIFILGRESLTVKERKSYIDIIIIIIVLVGILGTYYLIQKKPISSTTTTTVRTITSTSTTIQTTTTTASSSTTTSTSTTTITIITTTPMAYTCSDSDGKNYYTKGYVDACSGRGEMACYHQYDRCEGENVVREYFCKNNKMQWEDFECPQGCSDGACS